ncbi:MAG: hypothetical protein IPK08_16090 [Bacteroidetes bacterium]|nr:hypothetical protein [Bacteroidota bacterium]
MPEEIIGSDVIGLLQVKLTMIFTVERSKDGVTFEALGIVDGSGKHPR